MIIKNIGQDAFAELDVENKGFLPLKVFNDFNDYDGNYGDDADDDDDYDDADDYDEKTDKTYNCFRILVDC